MELYCAIDLIDGQAVRLERGDFARRHDFGDPLELARRYVRGGAKWLHVVDLDAARTGSPLNRDVVLAIARSTGLDVEAGGGIRTVADARTLLDGGVRRIVLGTVAQREPELLEEMCTLFPGQVAVGLDHRGGGSEVAVEGWSRATGSALTDALARIDDLPLAALIVTAIERDGSLEGPDLEGLALVLASTRQEVIASGGVSSAADLASLAGLEIDGRRLAGAIVGIALANGMLEVQEALAACETSV